ncbi:MAG: hypothetical protein QW745_01755 [Thermoplasmata archaeon]
MLSAIDYYRIEGIKGMFVKYKIKNFYEELANDISEIFYMLQ